MQVVTEKKAFISFDEPKIMAHFGISGLSDVFCANWNCSIEALMEKIKTVVNEKYALENREMSKNTFQLSGLSAFCCKKQTE